MTEKSKSLFKRIGIPAASSLVVALVLYLVTASIGEVKSYGQIRKTPDRLDKLEKRNTFNEKKQDSLCNAYNSDKTSQAIILLNMQTDIAEIKKSNETIVNLLLQKNK